MADIIIKGYARLTDAGIQAQLRQRSDVDNDADFVTLYFHLVVDNVGDKTTKKAIHFEKKEESVYRSLGTVSGAGKNDRTKLVDCVFLPDADFFYTNRQGVIDTKKFSEIREVTDFGSLIATIKSTDSKQPSHARSRFMAQP